MCVKAPFLSISNTVTLKYSHEKERRNPKYMSRDRLKCILSAKIKREFTTREQVCVRNYFVFASSSAVPVFAPFLTRPSLIMALSSAVSCRVIGCSAMTSAREIGMSRESGSTDNIEIGHDGDGATKQITYHVIYICP